ncbi:MAG: acyl carrier protein [Bacteriovoracaceae bacterium]|nr:acyl carrier protein [Bacteriovoracaceae bacterium]
MVTRKELLEHLLKVIEESAELKMEEKDYGTPLVELGLDSIYAVEIANEMEDMCDVVIEDRDIAAFRSINDIMTYFDNIKK